MMTKNQFILNIILFIPLMALNFLVYGIDGDIRFLKELKKFLKRG